MKKALSALLVLVLLVGLCACGKNSTQNTDPSTTPTQAPTENTQEVTISTTAATQAPTQETAADLTEEPSAAPTAAPTLAPTEEVTAAPTTKATAAPTTKATAAPTTKATAAPTTKATAAPTTKATAAPTTKATAAATATTATVATEATAATQVTAPTVAKPTVPVQTEHTHSYVDYICSCGEKAYLDPRAVELKETQYYGKFYEYISKDTETGVVYGEELHIPTIRFRDAEVMPGYFHIEIGNEYYSEEMINADALPYREYLYYTEYEGERWYYHGTGMGLSFCYALTEKEILVYVQEDLVDPCLKFMIMKDGSLLCTDVKEDFWDTDWETIGPLTKDKESVCGLKIVKEKNPDYNPDL